METKEQIRAEILEEIKQNKRNYFKNYCKDNPKKVKQWRKNYILTGYKKLVRENPKLFIEREDITNE